jgi:hypothetical protein
VTTLESPSPEGIWKALPDRCNPTGARSRHVAILAAFAVDVEQLAVAVYVAHLELRTLQQAEAAGGLSSTNVGADSASRYAHATDWCRFLTWP